MAHYTTTFIKGELEVDFLIEIKERFWYGTYLVNMTGEEEYEFGYGVTGSDSKIEEGELLNLIETDEAGETLKEEEMVSDEEKEMVIAWCETEIEPSVEFDGGDLRVVGYPSWQM